MRIRAWPPMLSARLVASGELAVVGAVEVAGVVVAPVVVAVSFATELPAADVPSVAFEGFHGSRRGADWLLTDLGLSKSAFTFSS